MSEEQQKERFLFLDGLRGLAALIVILNHLSVCFLHVVPGFWADVYGKLPYFLFSGLLPVQMFFAISGFALSVGYLHHRDKRQLTIMALRRYPRLVIPISASLLIAYIVINCGYIYIKPIVDFFPGKTSWLHEGFESTDIPHFLNLAFFVVFYHPSAYTNMAPQLWTIPPEFLGSFILFFALFISDYLRRKWLPCVLMAGVLYNITKDDAFCAFSMMYGVLMAVWYQHSEANRQFRKKNIAAILAVISAAIGIQLLKYPLIEYPPVTALCGGLVTWAVICSEKIAAVFKTRFFLILGKLSFPVYLLHSLIIASYSSYLFIYLVASGVSQHTSGNIVFWSTLVLIYLAGLLFYPIEYAAIRISHRFADWVIKPGSDNN